MTCFSIRKYILFCFLFTLFFSFHFFCVSWTFPLSLGFSCISSRQQSESGGRLFLAKVEFPQCLARITLILQFHLPVLFLLYFSDCFSHSPPWPIHSLMFSFGWMSIYWWAACPNNYPDGCFSQWFSPALSGNAGCRPHQHRFLQSFLHVPRDSCKEPRKDGLGQYPSSSCGWTQCATSVFCFTCKVIKLQTNSLSHQSCKGPNTPAICVSWKLLSGRLCLAGMFCSPNRHLSVSKFSAFKLNTQQLCITANFVDGKCWYFSEQAQKYFGHCFYMPSCQNPNRRVRLTSRLYSKARIRKHTVCCLQRKAVSKYWKQILG